MDKIINVGLASYGMSGQIFHAPFITAVPGFKLIKVVERSREKSKERYPWVEVVKDIDDILNDENIDLVVINTPNLLHYEQAKKALIAGKHVIAEKPFAVNSEEANELINISKKTGKILTVFQNRRFDGDFLTVRKVVEADMLGKLVEFQSSYDRFVNYLRPIAWKESEELGMGVLYDLGSHLIDQAQVLFGVPKSVTADLRIQREFGKNIDNFEVILDYGKLKVDLRAGMLVREKGPRFVLHGSNGSFIKFGLDPQEEALKKGLAPADLDNWGEENEEQWGTLNSDMNNLHFKGKIETVRGDYRLYYQNIYEAIVHGKELAVKPEEARNTIRIIELAMESNDKKQAIEFSI